MMRQDNCIFGVQNLDAKLERYEIVDRDVVEQCDVCIIGSGAAGAVLAKKFCDAGRSVILLEKGGYFEGEDMNQRDEEMIPLLWKNAGANFTHDMRITIAQGSCLGGSTVINDAVCFPIPKLTSRQWREAGVEISDEEWDAACAEVSDEIHVTKVREDELDRNSLLLKRGCTEAGYKEHYPNSRNCVNCMQCGLCHLGCHYETKQDMRVTYIHKALNDPNSRIRIFCNCDVEKLGQSYSNTVIETVEGSFDDITGNTHFRITVNAAIVILSAGSIASSYILQTNLISLDRVGRGLALHPAPFVIGDFPYLVRGHQGIPMAYTLHDFGVTNGVEKGGFLVEGIFVPPLQFAILISVSGPLQNELMKRYDHYAMAGVLIRDGSNGTISVTDQDVPRITYVLGQSEAYDIARGVEIIGKMWFKLGATRLISSHMDKVIINNEDELKELVNLIRSNPSGLMLGSAHPQGGNRMGSDPKICVVDSSGHVFGYKNLFVCDASVFPTALGVNPQLTVMSLATIVAERINKNWADYAVPISDELGQVCSISQPMYCTTSSLENLYESRDNSFSVASLINSDEDKIVDGKNWSFDAEALTIRNDRYWKGFLANDGNFLSTVEMYAGGFWKRFSKEGDAVKGVTHPYDFSVYAHNIAIEAQYPGFGKVIQLNYTDDLYKPCYDFLKMVDDNTILGEAFLGTPPKGQHLLSFSMSRKYRIDFMTQDDFQMIFDTKCRRPDPNEVMGIWEGRLVSNSTLSPVMFRFRYAKDSQGNLTCNYIFGDFLPGTSRMKLGEKELSMFDFTGSLFHDEIRMLRKDIMLGKYVSIQDPIFKLFEKSQGFLMRDNNEECLPYLLSRIA